MGLSAGVFKSVSRMTATSSSSSTRWNGSLASRGRRATLWSSCDRGKWYREWHEKWTFERLARCSTLENTG
jgi:hypothetical protein